MIEPKPGDVVSFFDEWEQTRKTGRVVEVRRSATNRWPVAVVKLQNGTETEVHPDRLNPTGDDQV